ncbi:Gfo/Idh/MocA family protein [Streptomyces sp. NPDC001388]|uniref:Gfo/Idh/MocA family protein n=1 Tax=Streptomyces sp. NPDC001388 TaxID=3364568 RepID=UPI0036A56193
MSERPVRFGVISCADIAWRRTLPVLAAAPQARITAIGSRDPDRAAHFAQRFGGAPVHGYRAVLERDDVDAVYVPLPTGLHREWVERALMAGKHVLVEKPTTVSAPETQELLALARERRLVLHENMTFPHHTLHAEVRRLLECGAIGELRELSAAFGIPPRPPRDVRYRPELGGGALLDVGVYPVRAALEFLGAGLEVAGAVLRADPASGVDVAGGALLARKDGVTAQVSFGFAHAYRNTYALWGSEGRLSVDRVYSPPGTLRPVVRIERQDHTEELILNAFDQFDGSTSAFVRAVRGARCGDPWAVTEQARVVDAVRARASVL